MPSPEEKAKHSRHRKAKQKERVRSLIAKDLMTSKYKQRVVKDKRGREHDLRKLTNYELIQLIQDND